MEDTTTTPTLEAQLLSMLKRCMDTFEVQDNEQAALKAEATELIEKVDDMEECIGCEQKFNYEKMTQDDAGENYCPECWAHFEPILKADYEEAVRNGEID